MRSSLAILALAAGASALPGAITAKIAPTATAPAGCMPTYAGSFEITVVNATTSKKRSLAERDALTLTLSSGVLTDAAGRTGYIASNYQFQFDAPPQAGAIYTAGFSVCGNNSLALGGSTLFYQCNSGSFYNLYDRSWAAQCSPVYLVALGGTAAKVTVASDGQPAATTALAISEKSDGQPQAVTQISDGQIQAPTHAPVLSQLSDGQPQAPHATSTKASMASSTSVVVLSQLSDGQPQAHSATAVKTSAVVVSQLSDGQPQAHSATTVKTSAIAVVSQLSDGQPIKTSAAMTTTHASATVNGTMSSASATLAQFTGAANEKVAAASWVGLFGVAAAVLAM